jgi:Spy/CpxP family protein refolding chaperone
MKKETLLTVAVVALLLLNFGTLGFLLIRRAPHAGGGRPGEGLDRHIVEVLQLDDAQKQQFAKLKTEHHSQMLLSDAAYREALENYFDLLKNDTVDQRLQDSLMSDMTRIQNERATVTYRHFADLKAMCRPEQKQRFEALLPELLQVILPHNNRAPRR